MEVIINISLLMLAAILLIGFVISKINENNMIEERTRNGEGVVQDFQAIIDYMVRDKKEISLNHPSVKKEVQDFARIYTKARRFHDLIITDREMRVVASKKGDGVDQQYFDDLLKKSIQSGELNTKIEKTGGLLSTHYKKLILSAPLWVHEKIEGGILVKISLTDVAMHLLTWQKTILISLILDAIVLIAFGSFLLSRILVKPMKDLVRLTQKISEGDFSQTIEVTSKNEIGQLISSFNRMIERLREKQESIESYLKSLELANKKLKEAQEELIRTEKLASIGRFAAGVAHEVGNPLGAILGYTSILEKEGVKPEEAKDYLRRIEKEIERINRIVRELLDFSRPSKSEIQEIEVNKVIENTLSLLSYQKNFKNIKTDLDLQTDLPRIKGDESQLSQVFINIILNAVDAMPEGGALRIRTEDIVVEDLLEEELQQFYPRRRKDDPLDSDYSRLRKPDPLSAILSKFSKGERLVKIRISDTGTGIPQENLERIFDPFFTTKDPDKGTGLGLSICLRIVESMGGRIRVESEVGKGSTFEIYLPTFDAGSSLTVKVTTPVSSGVNR
ncbi:MAG: HAMP domain-containing protein [Syntrophaceae bacterium]|nr:HAMP domain-containing protein [Syntrophaceae bacterium]